MMQVMLVNRALAAAGYIANPYEIPPATRTRTRTLEIPHGKSAAVERHHHQQHLVQPRADHMEGGRHGAKEQLALQGHGRRCQRAAAATATAAASASFSAAAAAAPAAAAAVQPRDQARQVGAGEQVLCQGAARPRHHPRDLRPALHVNQEDRQHPRHDVGDRQSARHAHGGCPDPVLQVLKLAPGHRLHIEVNAQLGGRRRLERSKQRPRAAKRPRRPRRADRHLAEPEARPTAAPCRGVG